MLFAGVLSALMKLSVFNPIGVSYLAVNTASKSVMIISLVYSVLSDEEELSSFLEKLHRVGRAESLALNVVCLFLAA